MLLMYNYVLLKMSTWYSKHVEESNNTWRINSIQCITLVVLYGYLSKMHGHSNIYILFLGLHIWSTEKHGDCHCDRNCCLLTCKPANLSTAIWFTTDGPLSMHMSMDKIKMTAKDNPITATETALELIITQVSACFMLRCCWDVNNNMMLKHNWNTSKPQQEKSC